jgi:sugar/nucleoside kinase (ribokinase family)
VDIFVPSAEEILYMMEPKQYADIISKAKGDILDEIPPDIYVRLGDRIMELGVSILMIKAGHRGAYLRTGDVQKLNATTPLSLPTDRWNHRDLWIPVFPADPARIKNACGAGDCAVAGFLTAILDGVDIEKAGRYAMLAGRDNLYGVDALSGLSDWTSMTDRIQKPA